MKLNKTLKIFSVIFECSTMGSIVLYIYNFYISSKKYEVIPATVRNKLNIFMIIAILSLIIFLIIKYVLYLRNRTKVTENAINNEENISTEIEDKIVERVIIHKDEYEVPKERRVLCPNCNNIVDKNAFLCLKCGYLLKEVVKEKVIEKHIYDNSVVDNKKIKNINFNNIKIKNMLINGSLVIGIIICLIFIIKIAIERGIIG